MQRKLFDISGNEVEIPQDEAFAKHTTLDNNVNIFFVKCCTKGSDAGFFANPQSMWFAELNSKRFDKRTNAKSVYEFKKVSEKTFKLYVHFLKTRNQVFLRQAERENNG